MRAFRKSFVAAIVPLALVASACGSSKTNTPSGGGSSASPAESPITGTLNGSGATFPAAFYEVVIQEYKKAQPGVTVSYNPVGSGTGRQALADGVVDFAGSDGLVKPEEKPKFKGGEFLYVPTVAAPITVSYNLQGIESVKLDADTMAKIFQRQITKWNDKAIADLNSGAKLPATDIVVAHRSDGSGTTENFTKFLVAAAPAAWKLGSGSTVEWPNGTQAGNGNQGVAQVVKTTPGAIGYVDLSDAKATGLQVAQVRNKAGKFVSPTIAAAQAALTKAQVNADLSYNPLDGEGDAAYPITAPTWILVYRNQTDKVKGTALKSFLTFLLTKGEDLAPSVDYASLPSDLRQKALDQVHNIVVPA
jgi:phosphate transport system substrate-binding protein